MVALADPIPPSQLADWATFGAHIVPLSVEQYHEMIRTGIIPEGSPIELLDGVLVLKDRSRRGEPLMSIDPLHATAVENLGDLRPQLMPLGLDVRSQQPITIPPRSEPEPDGSILRGPRSRYAKAHPSPADICCVFEASDSSLRYDRTTKVRIYARAGIPQYVIINIVDDVIEVFESPDAAAGTYAAPKIIPRDGVVTLKLFDGKTLDVPASKLLP